MEFFTSPEDLRGWIKSQESVDSAINKIMEITGRDEEQDIVDTCRSIFEKNDNKEVSNASTILFGVLAKHNLTTVKESQATQEDGKMTREAQIMRQPGEYEMPLRVCPKLPYSVGKRLISTYNCRHYCIDSLVLDDDPSRVYCAEALWRRHLMDKFAREFKDEDGEWVGGYINERFYKFPDAGTPDNPGVPRNGGNPMQLANGERSRLPRPHQYSMERRLEEGRGEETTDIIASNKKRMVLSYNETKSDDDEGIFKAFDDMVEMKNAGLDDESIITKIAEHYDISIPKTAHIYKMVNNQLQRHAGHVYVSMNKTAQSLPQKSTLVTKQDLQVTDMDGNPQILKINTNVVATENNGETSLHIVDGPDAGREVSVASDIANSALGALDDATINIQDAADEVLLNEEQPQIGAQEQPLNQEQTQEQTQDQEFPINEVPQS